MHTDLTGSAAFTAERSSSLLRRALLLDAIASDGLGLFGLVAADWLSSSLGVSSALLRGAGLVLIPFVVLLLVAASRETVSAPLVGVIIAFNVLWVLASLGLLVTGSAPATGLGVGFVLVQAAAVVLFAWLQDVGIRRSPGHALPV